MTERYHWSSVHWHSSLDSQRKWQPWGACQHKHLLGDISYPFRLKMQGVRLSQDRKENRMRWRVSLDILQVYWYHQECSLLQQDIVPKVPSLYYAEGLPSVVLQPAFPSQLLGQHFPLLFLCYYSLRCAPTNSNRVRILPCSPIPFPASHLITFNLWQRKNKS